LQADALNHLFDTMDEDGDGEISFDEFKKKFKECPELWEAKSVLNVSL